MRDILPYIELRLFIRYDPDNLGPISDFIIDIDKDCDIALIVMRYEAADGAIGELFSDFPNEIVAGEQKTFFRELSERIPNLYQVNVWAEAPNDPTNRLKVPQSSVKSVLRTGFINAQRGLDDVTTRESDVLSGVLEALYNAAILESADEKDRKIVEQLSEAVRSIQDSIDSGFRLQVDQLLPKLEDFGYPGLGGSKLTTETELDIEKLLTNHTKVRYEGHDGALLPESYNGLARISHRWN